MKNIVLSYNKVKYIAYAVLILLVFLLILYYISTFNQKTFEGLTSPSAQITSAKPSCADPINADPNGNKTSAALSLSTGPQTVTQNQIVTTIENKLEKIQEMIDTINSQLPKDIIDISINSVALVPWEARQTSKINITNRPYEVADENNSSRIIQRAKWLIDFTLPLGPKGDKGAQGPPGDKGVDGNSGDAGSQGNRGPWGATDNYSR